MSTHQEIATAAQAITAKANLIGADVPAFVTVHNWLEAIKNGHLVVLSAEELQDIARIEPEKALNNNDAAQDDAA